MITIADLRLFQAVYQSYYICIKMACAPHLYSCGLAAKMSPLPDNSGSNWGRAPFLPRKGAPAKASGGNGWEVGPKSGPLRQDKGVPFLGQKKLGSWAEVWPIPVVANRRTPFLFSGKLAVPPFRFTPPYNAQQLLIACCSTRLRRSDG